MSDFRILLVGESNPYGSDPEFALWPQPPNATGGRLARVLGLMDAEYLCAFERRNLMQGDGWSAPSARRRADDLLRGLEHTDRLVLLGARVSAAFGVDFRENLCAVRWAKVGTRNLLKWVLVVPHPSGRSREWNDPDMQRRARGAVERLRRPDPEEMAERAVEPRNLDLAQVVRESARGQRLEAGPAWEGECPQVASGLPAQIATLPEGDQCEVDRFTQWLSARAKWIAGEISPDEFARAERDLYPNGLDGA